ncbi:MAG: hypothetical protein VX372_00835 [Verrucomicrobiota bacterium]|nr:hypothetical protein [Verrucomicrobiota bacterium]MEC7235237.1 hypothetical protein [Verrucomicrobiota bacterium]MEC8209354.1 hypothetical protein [Verrucomicrobiota bacterium]MEC8614819.1 hypothetical protein [Verrucomicrobiota bacterium]MEE2988098.1 hypothetical protein [Verrucomicrobiota bacterium]
MADPQRIKNSPIHLILRILALVLILVSTAFWLSTGRHTGFSKDRVEIPQVDPITQIEYVVYEERFVLGVEFLALAYGLGVTSFGLSFAFRRKPD